MTESTEPSMIAKLSLKSPWLSETLRRPAVLKKMSILANENVKSKIGSSMGDFAVGLFAANSLTGIGVLTVPFAFQQSGWLLGCITLLVCMLMSYTTGTYIIEAEAIVNALHYAKAAGGLREELLPEVRKECSAHRTDPNRAGEIFARSTIQQGNSDSAFKIRDRVEVGRIGEELLENKIAKKLVYVVIICFAYGSISAFVVTVNTSLANTVKRGRELVGAESMEIDTIYPWCLAFTLVLAFMLCSADLQKTRIFTIIVMFIRFVAMVIMVIAATSDFLDEGIDIKSAWQSIPYLNLEGFGCVFGNCVYVFTLHHALPSMIAPLEHQRDAGAVLGVAFGVVVAIMVLLSVSAMLTYGSSVEDFYNLNFAHLDWLGGFVALFLVSYPSFAISTIPPNAITLRNNLCALCNAPPCDPDNPFEKTNIFFTSLVLLPPFTIAFITRNIQLLIKYVGGYLGLTVSYLLPVILIVIGRKKLAEVVKMKNVKFKWHLKSPCGNYVVYSLVIVFYLLALVRQMLMS